MKRAVLLLVAFAFPSFAQETPQEPPKVDLGEAAMGQVI